MDQPLARCSSVPPPRATHFWRQVPRDLRTLSPDTGEVAQGWLFVLGWPAHRNISVNPCPPALT